MSRPPKCRRIGFVPDALYFKPAGIPVRELEEITLCLDEMEALRLADREGLYQEEAARRMDISRQTFANILNAAHRKIAEALIAGKALRIEGGHTEMGPRRFRCEDCAQSWEVPPGTGRPPHCPQCGRDHFHRVQGEDDGHQPPCGGTPDPGSGK